MNLCHILSALRALVERSGGSLACVNVWRKCLRLVECERMFTRPDYFIAWRTVTERNSPRLNAATIHSGTYTMVFDRSGLLAASLLLTGHCAIPQPQEGRKRSDVDEPPSDGEEDALRKQKTEETRRLHSWPRARIRSRVYIGHAALTGPALTGRCRVGPLLPRNENGC
jgi:hypothetical protein